MNDHIKENIDIIKVNFEYGACWFCKQNPVEDKTILSVEMYNEDVKIKNQIFIWKGIKITSLRYETVKVKVPRCARCKLLHNREKACIGAGGIVGFIVGSGISILISISNYWDGGFIIIFMLSPFIGAIIGAIIGACIDRALRPKDVLPESAKSKFPSIETLLSKGWKFGDGHPTID